MLSIWVAVGLSEENAVATFGPNNVKVYHTYYQPLEWKITKSQEKCYVKLICHGDNEKVIGFHILGPNAGEITQGYALALRFGPTKEDFDMTIGIHPTSAEYIHNLKYTKDDEIKYNTCDT